VRYDSTKSLQRCCVAAMKLQDVLDSAMQAYQVTRELAVHMSTLGLNHLFMDVI